MHVQSTSSAHALGWAPVRSHSSSLLQLRPLPPRRHVQDRCENRSAWICRHRPSTLHAERACRQGVRAANTEAATQQGELPALLDLQDGYEQAHAFTAYANWLIPGRLMVGRYPYVERSRCTTREQGEQQLRAVLEAGLTTFVCLQDEVPAQQKMRLGGVEGFLPYNAIATLIYSSMGPPPSLEEAAGLRNQYVDRFLPTKRQKGASSGANGSNGAGSAAGASTSGAQGKLQFTHWPIVDLSVPPRELLDGLLPDLQARLAAGESVYLHCWGGRGRAGLVGACLLASAYGLSAEEALERVGRAFSTRNDEGYVSPQTEEQRQLVRDYIAS